MDNVIIILNRRFVRTLKGWVSCFLASEGPFLNQNGKWNLQARNVDVCGTFPSRHLAPLNILCFFNWHTCNPVSMLYLVLCNYWPERLAHLQIHNKFTHHCIQITLLLQLQILLRYRSATASDAFNEVLMLVNVYKPDYSLLGYNLSYKL